ncbi:MAG: RNA polymerase sigma factor [Bryobacteraceae bacterium]
MLLHEKYAHVTRLEELVPLSLQIVRFKMASVRRKSHRRGEYTSVSVEEIQLPDLESNPATALEQQQLMDRLTGAISQMEERCRELFRMKLEGRTFPEIQEILHVKSINTIYTWDSRCRKRLQELMGGRWETRS